MISFDDVAFRYDPWPLGIVTNVLAPDLFDELSRTFPPPALFRRDPELGQRASLDRGRSRAAFDAFFRATPAWRELRRSVESRDFVARVLAMLERHGIDVPDLHGPVPLEQRIARMLRGRSGSLRAELVLVTMSADGGALLPHTDGAAKFANIAIAMEDAWDPALGGSTDVVAPLDPRRRFSLGMRRLRFDEVCVVERIPHVPNQAVVVIRTAASWHSIGPMTNPGSPAVRRTLNINILHN